MRLNKHRGRRKERSSNLAGPAFTLIELMLAIAIMGVIVYALYHVFNQTQRAMRSNEIQGDISEKARAIMDLISREIEQSQATFGSLNGFQEDNMVGGPEFLPPRLQKATDRADIQPRTNMLYNVFFLNNRTNAWQGIGYRVVNYTNGVGSLQRFETNLFGHRPASNIMV